MHIFPFPMFWSTSSAKVDKVETVECLGLKPYCILESRLFEFKCLFIQLGVDNPFEDLTESWSVIVRSIYSCRRLSGLPTLTKPSLSSISISRETSWNEWIDLIVLLRMGRVSERRTSRVWHLRCLIQLPC